ncbi:MAG: carboxyl-terminal processing protease, partial [Psychroserpens sp.]
MRLLKISLLFILTLSLTSCFEDRDDNAIAASEINDFVWKGMNAVYLYKDEIPDLANDRFMSNEDYANYLNSFIAPENIFESLIYQRETTDRFSVILSNYIEF